VSEETGIKGSQKVPSGIGGRLSQSGGPPGQVPPAPTPPGGSEASAAERIASLQRRLAELRNRAGLSDVRGALVRLEGIVAGFPAAVAEIRRLGYAYRAGLEQEAEALQKQWQDLGQKVEAEAATQGQLLLQGVDALQRRLTALPVRPDPQQLDVLERELALLEGRVSSAYEGLKRLYAAAEEKVHQMERLVQSLRWMLDQVAAATFRLRPDENLVEALEAQYLTEGQQDGPQGILYLTDQRLLFEQKEEVTKKKLLFIPTEKERVQRLLLDLPIGSVQRAEANERGALLWKKELLELALSAPAPVSRARFVLKGDSEACQALIGRIQSGDIAEDRVGPAPERAEPPRQLPTRCPTCSAALTTEIVRGMRSITCEYCGTVIPL
jgi:hypothetical protein